MELAAALQFPLYFGKNWNALRACLQDLAWLKAQAYLGPCQFFRSSEEFSRGRSCRFLDDAQEGCGEWTIDQVGEAVSCGKLPRSALCYTPMFGNLTICFSRCKRSSAVSIG